MNPHHDDVKEAERFVEEHGCFEGCYKRDTIAAIAGLLTARRAKEGHVIDDKGVERRLLGTLPLTIDGCVVGNEAKVWACPWGGPPSECVMKGPRVPPNPWDCEIPCQQTYSTRESALSAQVKEQGAQDGK